MTLLSTGAGLVRACHPAPTVAVTAIAMTMAHGAGAGGARVGEVGVAVLAGQLSVGWSNDWIDADRDRATGRRDKPVVTGQVDPAVLRAVALLALAASIPLSLLMGGGAALAHLTAVAGAWAYNLGLKSTVVSWLPYCWAFGLLPVVATATSPRGSMAPWWAVAAGVLLGFGAHLTNTLADLDADRATGVRGLPQRWGRRRTAAVGAWALVLGSGTATFGAPGLPSITAAVGFGISLGVTGVCTVVARIRPMSRLPFLGAILVAAITVGALVAAIGETG